jgi:anaerobic magnesium-protoporphyrin IX monomethyl ester cyclase
MKILFVVPPNIGFNDFIAPPCNVKVQSVQGGKAFGSVITDMPLGIISLSAYLKKNIDVDTRGIDFNVALNKLARFDWSSFRGYFKEVLQKEIRCFQPDVIGISALFSTAYKNLIDLGEVSRDICPDAFVIAGGNVPTVSYKDIFGDTQAFDAVCHGEGELPLLELLVSDSMHEHVEKSLSWITKNKLDRKYDFEHNFIDELDEIPFDYSIIRQDDYELNPTIRSYSSVKSKGKSFNIMTSRGCPFRCIFCASHRTHGRDMRYHSFGRVKEDILRLKNEFGINVITIEDDHFMGDKQRAYEIVKFIGEQGVTAFFPNSLALYALSREMLVTLKDAGVDQLILAVESGSDYVLKNVMKKPLKLDIVSRVVKDCREIGIYTDCNILLGLPGERKQDIEDTRKFLKTVPANWFRINVATPLLGSEMHDICEEKSYFKGVVIESNYKKAIVGTEDFDPQFIQDVTYDINIELNFVYNADMHLGEYETALKGFENALNAKPDHAIALYYSSVCHQRLDHPEKARYLLEQARAAYTSSPIWEKYAKLHGIPITTFGAIANA